MKTNYIKAYLLNPSEEEIMIKIPRSYEMLRNVMVNPRFKFNVDNTLDDTFDAESFGELLYSATDIDIRNFTIEEPTNIFYLNAYFMILKERKLPIPGEELVITTEKLKKMIAELLNIENQDLNLEKVHGVISGEMKAQPKENKQEEEREKQKSEKERRKGDGIDESDLPEGATLGDVDDVVAYWEADGKPIFSINKLQRIHRERKQREG